MAKYLPSHESGDVNIPKATIHRDITYYTECILPVHLWLSTMKYIQTLPISKRTEVDIYSLKPKGSFFVLFVGFPIAKLLFSIKEWGKKVKLGQFLPFLPAGDS